VWRQLDQILDVEACGFLRIETVPRLLIGLRRHRQQRIAINRHPRYIILVVKLLVLFLASKLYAVKQLMAHSGEDRVLFQLGLVEPSIFLTLHVATLELDQQVPSGAVTKRLTSVCARVLLRSRS
jgi:hypothetical protein